MNATATTTDRAIPEWVTEDPCDVRYSMESWHPVDGTDQDIEMTRAEFIALKRHLAEMRGLTAKTIEEETEEPSLKDMAETATEKILTSHAEAICSTIRSHVSIDLGLRERQPARVTRLFGDLSLLHLIVDDWQTGGRDSMYPGELPIVAAMKANLDT